MQLDTYTLADFRDIIYDENSGEIRSAPRQRLLDWIENYLEQDNRSEDVIKYTVAYWNACMQEMVDLGSDVGLLS
jgi:hypothetical protein